MAKGRAESGGFSSGLRRVPSARARVQSGIMFRASRGHPLSRHRRRFNRLASRRRWIAGKPSVPLSGASGRHSPVHGTTGPSGGDGLQAMSPPCSRLWKSQCRTKCLLLHGFITQTMATATFEAQDACPLMSMLRAAFRGRLSGMNQCARHSFCMIIKFRTEIRFLEKS